MNNNDKEEPLRISALSEKLKEDLHKVNLLLRMEGITYEEHENKVIELVRKHNERVFLIIDTAYENSKKN